MLADAGLVSILPEFRSVLKDETDKEDDDDEDEEEERDAGAGSRAGAGAGEGALALSFMDALRRFFVRPPIRRRSDNWANSTTDATLDNDFPFPLPLLFRRFVLAIRAARMRADAVFDFFEPDRELLVSRAEMELLALRPRLRLLRFFSFGIRWVVFLK